MAGLRGAIVCTFMALTGVMAAASVASRERDAGPEGSTTTTRIVANDPYAGDCKPLAFAFSQGIGTDSNITLRFSHSLASEPKRRVEHVFNSWYGVGNYGGFGIFFSYASDPSILHQGRVIQWFVDTGGSGRAAFLPLAHALQGLACVDKGVALLQLTVKGL